MTSAKPIVPERELLSRKFYVPTFKLELGGDVAHPDYAYDILDVTYTDSGDGPSQFQATVMNWDAERRKLKYLDDATFAPGKDVLLRMGYQEDRELAIVFRGTITTIDVDFPEGGRPSMKVSGLSRLALLQNEQRDTVWPVGGGTITDSEIAEQIAGKVGLTIEAEASSVSHRSLAQDNKYDLIFLKERADWIGYEVVYDSNEDKLYFRKSTSVTRKQYRLRWGLSLLRFKPKLSTANQVNQVKVRWWDPGADEAKEVTVSREELEVPGLEGSKMRSDVNRSLATATEVLIDHPVDTESEARNLARAKLQKVIKEMQTCEGETIGLPSLRAGTVVDIEGVGDTFGGRYFVTGSTHAISDRGYTTQFSGRREAPPAEAEA